MILSKYLRDRRFSFSLILTCLCISEVRAQEEITDPPSRTPQDLMFTMDRKPEPQQRIINGGIAEPHAYPFQVGLNIKRPNGIFLCGGTLISTEWVLTAAHCLERAEMIAVILGAHNIEVKEPSKQVFTAEVFIKHTGYNSFTLVNDIGLVKLPSPVSLNFYIQLVKLVQDERNFEGAICKCLGWGTTLIGATSNVLRYVDVEVMPNDACKSYTEFQLFITEKHLCTSGEGILGFCQGDSGGPLMIGNEQLGIVSFSSQKCDKQKPSAYTRVPEFIDWIQDQTGLRFVRAGGETCKMGLNIKVFMLSIGFFTLYLRRFGFEM